MKTRQGVPTKKEIAILFEQHGLLTFGFDDYPQRGVTYGSRARANEKAAAIVEHLQKEGFTVEHRLADHSLALTGNIKINPRCN